MTAAEFKGRSVKLLD